MGKKKSKSDARSNDKPVGDEATGQDGPTLERQRERMQARAKAVDTAELEVTRLEQDLENNDTAIRQQESAMEAATARVADLEQALKNSSKQRKQLRSALKMARVDVERAREDAAAAERKYEKAVLKEVVRREKVVDLTTRPK